MLSTFIDPIVVERQEDYGEIAGNELELPAWAPQLNVPLGHRVFHLNNVKKYTDILVSTIN